MEREEKRLRAMLYEDSDIVAIMIDYGPANISR